MSVGPAAAAEARFVGRYAIYGEIASGGMATVHYGRLFGTAGFSRTVAIKRLHAQFAKDPEFVAMFLDEAHVAASIRHPNVVPTFDVVATEGEVFIVMEYVRGETLARLLLLRADGPGLALPPRIAAAIVSGVLHGLHAAHEATNDRGEPQGIVHRDVSPQNVLVGTDGTPRLLDFGIAKARDRIHVTRGGLLKGKVAYMAPEQLAGAGVDRRTDVWAAGVILWESLVGRRCFHADGEFATAERVRSAPVEPPSRLVRGLPAELDEIVARALARDPSARFATAREMASALEDVVGIATPSDVGAWVESRAEPELRARAQQVATLDRIDTAAAAVAQDLHDAPTDPRHDPDPDGSARTRALEPPVAAATTTHASLSRAILSPRPRRRVGVLAVAATTVALLGAGAIAMATRPSRSASTAATVPSAAPSAAVAGSAPLPYAAPDAPALPPASVAKDPAGPPTASAPSGPAAPARRTAPPARRARPSCDPPYSVDDRGVRHLRRECL
jgi:hypothetical protein